MKKNFLIAICFFGTSTVVAQNQKRQIEINPYIKFDKYPQFSYVLGGRPSTDYVNIKGTSFGINFAYKIPISKLLFLKPGVGYYKYSFNEITRKNTSFGTTKFRDINFISPLLIPFFTDKYHYNSISANIGLERLFLLKNSFHGVVGFQLNNYFTISQKYHLILNPEGSQDYKKKNKNYFGSSGILYLNLVKKIKQVSLGPSFVIPVFDIWKTDATFQEETNNDTRNKWFNGIGIGISFNYSLPKKK